MHIKSKLNLNFCFKISIYVFLLSIFSYVYYFSLNNIVNYWTYSEIHINYNLGFAKRGFLGTIMLYLEENGLEKNIFFSTLFYIFNLLNILLFLKLLNRYNSDKILLFAFFALNPALLLFSFYDLGGYARFEIFGLFTCILHAYFLQNLYHEKIKYFDYLKRFFIIIIPISLICILIQEINILFLSFHLFSILIVQFKYRFKGINNFKFLILIYFIVFLLILYLLFTHPFTKDFALELYNNLPSKDGTSFWIWEAISNSFSERLNIEIQRMSSPEGAIRLYFFIFLFYLLPIIGLLHITTFQSKLAFYLSILSIIPFSILFFIGQDWGRWIHIVLFLIFLSYIQFNEKKINALRSIFEKVVLSIFITFVFFQFTFTRIPHCCNLIRLNLDVYGGIIPKVKVFSDIINNKIDIEKRFKSF